MINRYSKGRRKEYAVKKELEKEGYLVTRSSGSHGAFDLIAVHIPKRIIQFIQCKSDNFSKKEKRRLEEKYADIHCKAYMCGFLVR